jgi:hypothetical protein
MDLANSNSSTAEMGNAATSYTRRAKFAAGILSVVVITALVATVLVDQSRGNAGQATKADPLVGPAAVEFRAGERVLSSVLTNPLVGPAAVEFRAGERQGATK